MQILCFFNISNRNRLMIFSVTYKFWKTNFGKEILENKFWKTNCSPLSESLSGQFTCPCQT